MYFFEEKFLIFAKLIIIDLRNINDCAFVPAYRTKFLETTEKPMKFTDKNGRALC